jgi:hypothetical protein
MFGPKEENLLQQFMLWKQNWMISRIQNWTFKVKKIADFNEEQAEIISARIIQKNHQPIT